METLVKDFGKDDEWLDVDEPKHHGDDIEVDDDTAPPVDKMARQGLAK